MRAIDCDTAGVFSSIKMRRLGSTIFLIRNRPGVAALVIVIAASILHGLVWAEAPLRGGDTATYLEIAESLRAGEISKPFPKTPGYPLLLLLCGLPPTKTTVWVGLLLHGLSTMLGFWLMAQIGISVLSRMIFVLLMCLPLYAQSAGILLSENLAEISLTIAFALWFHSMHKGSVSLGVAAGVAAAWCALVRPSYQLLPLLLVFMSLTFQGLCRRYRNQTMKAAAGLAPVIGMVFLVALMAHNWRSFGYFGLVPGLGMNLCNRTALFVERADPRWEPLRNAMIEARNDALIRGKSHTALTYQWDHWEDFKRATGLDDLQLLQQLTRLNVSLIVENPLEYLAAVGRAVVNSLFPYMTSLTARRRVWQAVWTALHFSIIALWVGQLWIFGGACLMGLITAVHRRCKWLYLFESQSKEVSTRLWIYWGALFFIAYTIAINSMADIGEPRQRCPVDIFILMQCIIGVEALVFAWRRGDPSSGRQSAAG